jgi:hypothetical protein
MNTHSRSIMAPCGETIAPPTVRAQLRPTPTGRRGVLLLVVLSMLTLFLMLGAAYLVAATRAREAARAYARLTLGSDDARVPHAQLLDFVLLRAIRGPAIPAVMVGVAPVSFESLLADKYGAGSISGTATNITQTGPIIEITLSSTNNVRPTDLCGRVLTFAEPGRAATSHRIIRARAIDDTSPNPISTNTPSFTLKLSLDTPILTGPFTKPSAGRIVVNGREFAGATGDANESWDGFGADNPFLARVGTATISTSTVTQVSYLPDLVTTLLSGTWDYDNDGITDAADNDNDGVWDGAFLDVGIPNTVDGNGNAVQLRASVLIVDLDGRFNVNAHDSIARLAHAGTNLWPGIAAASTPMGSGYGPAEVNGARMFSTTTSATENPAVLLMAGGGTVRLTGTRGGASRFTQSGNTARLDFVEGRYGRDYASAAWPAAWPLTTGTTIAGSAYSLPGLVGANDEPSRTNDRRADASQVLDESNGIPAVWWTGSTSFNWATRPVISGTQSLPRAVFNSPPDLHGRMRTTTQAAVGLAAVPQLVFEKPEWSNTSFESTDDPYEMPIDTRTGRGGWLHDPATSTVSGSASYSDNPFLPADLEPVLRPYDGDTNRLALRLAAILGSAAEDSRLKVTTDSWDTTAVTGSAAGLIYGGSVGTGWLQNATSGALFGTSAITGIIGGEIARGERFDLNRPLTNAKPSVYNPTNLYYVQRQAYFKDLYTLLVALGEPANATTAQWAANVVEFRDADSTMTPFEYDTNPADGWDVDNDARDSSGDAKSAQREMLWGAERPEMLITETSAWEDDTAGELFIMLHRPWNAIAYGKNLVTGGTASLAGEPVDPDLDSSSTSPTNVVDLGRKSGAQPFTLSSGTCYPIWRLRIVDTAGNSKYVRLDTNATASDTLVSSAITSAAATPKISPDSWLCLQGNNTLSGTIQATGTVAMGASFRVPGTPGAATVNRNATVYLERLTDPAATVSTASNATAWTQDPATANTVPMYRIVDQAPVTVVNRIKVAGVVPPGQEPTVTRRQRTNFWKRVFGSPASDYILSHANMTGGGAVWLPWPNRPFVSSVELFLVPGREQLDLLTNYARPTAASNDLVSMAVPQLFDAVHVPTRFAGIHRGYTTDCSSSTGIFNEMTPVNQLSSFREPGRVNLNTVVADDVWNAVVAGPLAAAAVSRSTAAFTTTQARSMANLLALSGASTVVVSDTNSVTTVLAHDRNPLHELYTATRLANTVTPRSNVFAIWVTLRESTANDPDSVKYRRAFYIVDRSISVGYEAGKDHNVRDMIRLRRIIE